MCFSRAFAKLKYSYILSALLWSSAVDKGIANPHFFGHMGRSILSKVGLLDFGQRGLFDVEYSGKSEHVPDNWPVTNFLNICPLFLLL